MVSSIFDSIFTIFREKWWGMMHKVSLHPLASLSDASVFSTSDQCVFFTCLCKILTCFRKFVTCFLRIHVDENQRKMLHLDGYLLKDPRLFFFSEEFSI